MTSMTATKPVSLDDKFDVDATRVLLNGNQAVVRLMLMQAHRDRMAGLNTAGFVSGYRGSPLAGLDMSFVSARKRLAEADIHFHAGLNEDLAATSVWGSQQLGIVPGARKDGVFGLWYGKGPGVDRSGDALKHANAAGTSRHGGVIALAGDDHVAQSSSLAHQSEFALADALIPVFVPATLGELINYGLYGYALSRASGLWVGMKVTAAVIETTATVMSSPIDIDFRNGDTHFENLHLRWPDDPLAQEERLYAHKLPAALAFLARNPINRMVMVNASDRIGVLSIGKSALDVEAALTTLGVAAGAGVRFLKMGVAWPPQPDVLRRFAVGLSKIVVVEEKRALLETQLRDALYGMPDVPVIVGKRDENGVELFRQILDLDLDTITRALGMRIIEATQSQDVATRMTALPQVASPQRLAARTPFFCSGCPHNASTRVPEGSLALGGIGCHSMAMTMDRGMTAYTHMGAEGANWIGLAPFTNTAHIFQNLGDGTYFHSGSLAIRAAIAAKATITYKILFNNAVAMTGGQAIDGELTVPILVDQLLAEGVGKIEIVAENPSQYGTLWANEPRVALADRSAFEGASLRLRETLGTTVLIYDQSCAAEKRRKIKGGERAPDRSRVFINERVCEGCGDCVAASNCLSVVAVDTAWGEKRAIDQGSCNTDLSCLKGFCPSLVTVVGGTPRTKPQSTAANLPDLPTELERVTLLADYRILVGGVGGTGVVTVGAVIAMAAHIEGKGATILDATGMAQKGGSVWSHVTLSPLPGSSVVAKIPDGAADSLIAFDTVVASSPQTLSKLSHGMRAIVNTSVSPTGEQVLSPLSALPIAAMRQQIENAAPQTQFLDATALAISCVGDPLATNMFMVGYAYQTGLIPLACDSLEQAIRLNGRDVTMNLRAFGWGRCAAAGLYRAQSKGLNRSDDKRDNQSSLHRAIALMGRSEPRPDLSSLPASKGEPETNELDTLIEARSADLMAYGGPSYVRRFHGLVDRIVKAEAAIGESTAISEAAVRGYYKLLAIKDEWEVARLYTDKDFANAMRDHFEGPYKILYHFAPPVFGSERTGRPKKRAFGSWFYPVLWIMARLRGLRGSLFDPFTRTAERRRERALIGWYEKLIDMIVLNLTAENRGAAQAMAKLPDDIRGYGAIRAAAIDAVLSRQQALQAQFEQSHAEPVTA